MMSRDLTKGDALMIAGEDAGPALAPSRTSERVEVAAGTTQTTKPDLTAGAIFSIADPGERLPFTGERYTTGVAGDIQNEHYHRYLFALRLCEGRDVLDVASGEGYGSALLAAVARSVVGVDIDDNSVAFAARAYPRENLSFRTGSAYALPLADSSVDTVISFETIEHISDHTAFLHEVKRVLRPNGTFVVSTPDRKVYSEVPNYRNPFHLRELSREEFATLLGAEFRHLRMFEQQVIAGSILSAVETATGVTESFATTDGQNFMFQPRLPNAPYLVAVATAEPASLPSTSVLHGLWTDAAAASVAAVSGGIPSSAGVSGAAKEIVAQRAEISELRGRLLDANLEAAKTKRQLLEMDHERGFLRAMLTSARRLADQARAEQVHARASAEAEAEARVAGQIDAFRRDEARTAAQIDAFRRDSAEAEARAAGQIDAFRRSTSWRVTRPLRGVRILARRIRGAVR